MFNKVNNSKKIVFYYPQPLESDPKSSSQLRPLKMINAFEKKYCEVFVISGYSRSRKERIKVLKKRIESGERFEFMYVELLTMPIFLSELHRMPVHLFFEYIFFNWFRRKAGKIGFFYRDIYWRFASYIQKNGYLKYMIALVFYKLELLLIKKVGAVVFLPNRSMMSYFPKNFSSCSNTELPPGGDFLGKIERKREGSQKKELKLLYVGGVGGDFYDISSLLKVIEKSNCAILTICVRENEWKSYVKENSFAKNLEKINVKFLSSSSVDSLYKESDLFICFRRTNEYLKFCAPYKVFEALSWQTPIIETRHTGGGNIVENNNWGWVVSNDVELQELLEDLYENKNKIYKVRNKMLLDVSKNSWIERVKTVERELS